MRGEENNTVRELERAAICDCGHVYYRSTWPAGCPRCFNSDFPIPPVKSPTSCTEVQEGGNHYHQGSIQPIEYIYTNQLNFFEGNTVKYVTRARRKGTPVEDLKKALHYIQLNLKLEHGIDSEVKYSDTVSGN